MAKVPFTKLKCKIDTSVKEVKINEEVIIEVKQYLPIQEKLKLISNVINSSHEEDNNYANPVKVKVYSALEIIEAYTNISFTDKQKEERTKLYDALQSSGIINKIYENIPKEEYECLINGIKEAIPAIYAYYNSVFGIIESLKDSVDTLNLETADIAQKIANPEVLGFVKNLLTNVN